MDLKINFSGVSRKGAQGKVSTTCPPQKLTR